MREKHTVPQSADPMAETLGQFSRSLDGCVGQTDPGTLPEGVTMCARIGTSYNNSGSAVREIPPRCASELDLPVPTLGNS